MTERGDVAARVWRGLVEPLGRAESAAVLGVAAVTGLAVARQTGTRRGPGAALLLGAVAVDVTGGMVAFQLPATRERYRSSSLADRLGLAAAHVQCLALPPAGEGTWSRALARWAGVVGATAVLQAVVPERRRRAAGTALGAVLAAADLATDRSAQRWLGPVWYLKLVAGHATLPDPR
ncbi:hypothetical protein [uncultured Micrococcus sp.]|uniref:hypothetical protein n=1 Tax=uncultured Micrococcus sp. TaxID=114051 RepID=UPI0025DE522F|nr:hypothetical protein [uncultured Micrococcus sp.]